MNNNEVTGTNVVSTSKTDNITNQITELRREVDYNTRDYAIDFLVSQFHGRFINFHLKNSQLSERGSLRQA
ncbi:hypothetical protein AGMMS50276_17270 [Synergistales bacterium]|nr:hypothetical protein AGMMS50276_17270 [Synergistales bacterium]